MEVLNGSAPGYITVNFPDVMASDLNQSSYYVVGGRTYFEANTYASSGAVNSFTYKGFFD